MNTRKKFAKLLKMTHAARTFAFMEGTVGPLYNTETVEECQNICVQMTKCMAYTYEVVS